MDLNDYFKKCPCCFHLWQSQDEFLSDPNLKFNGYQVNFKQLEHGMFYFTHRAELCESTLTIMVKDFLNLYTGKFYEGSKALTEECPRYCLDENQLSRCDVVCECAFAREIIHIVVSRQAAATEHQGCIAH